MVVETQGRPVSRRTAVDPQSHEARRVYTSTLESRGRPPISAVATLVGYTASTSTLLRRSRMLV